MSKKIAMVIALLMMVVAGYAKTENGENNDTNTFAFWAVSDNANSVDELFKQLKDLTFTSEQMVPGDPMKRTVINKGSIYKAVCHVSKSLKAEVKDGKMSEDEYNKTMAHALRVGIAAFYADDSKTFEDALKNSKKNLDQELAIFNNTTLKR